jgi:hypothetical protein
VEQRGVEQRGVEQRGVEQRGVAQEVILCSLGEIKDIPERKENTTKGKEKVMAQSSKE